MSDISLGAPSRPEAPHAAGHEPQELAFELTDVGLKYSNRGMSNQVLRDLSFSCAPGEIVGIVGRSGTGKTTLLRLLGGLMVPTSGTLRMFGKSVSKPTGEAVIVFQDYANALLPWRSIEKNVALPLYKLPKAARNERVQRALEMVGLADKRSYYPWQLSGGMQQRVQIARALAIDAQIMLMDEPFGALDAMTKASLQDELLAVQESTGMTIVFITHDLEEAIYLSDRVVVISGSPGTITDSVTIDLPRPREQLTTREDPRYISTRHELTGYLAEAVETP